MVLKVITAEFSASYTKACHGVSRPEKEMRSSHTRVCSSDVQWGAQAQNDASYPHPASISDACSWSHDCLHVMQTERASLAPDHLSPPLLPAPPTAVPASGTRCEDITTLRYHNMHDDAWRAYGSGRFPVTKETWASMRSGGRLITLECD